MSAPIQEVGAPPNSRPAEESVVGQLLAKPDKVAGVVAQGLVPDDFWHTPMRVLYERIMECYYADESIDALSVGEAAQNQLTGLLRCSGPEAVEKVIKLSQGHALNDTATDHAKVIKRHSDYRRLLNLGYSILMNVQDEEGEPHEIAGGIAQEAMKIATSGVLTDEILDYGNLGRRFILQLQTAIAARQQGIQLGVHFDVPWVDRYTSGIKGSELWICGGEPGVGKSATIWRLGQNFAQKQMAKDEDKRIGTFVLSLEMAEEPSSVRLAQTITGLDGGRMRQGDISQRELTQITNEWAALQNLPFYFNFTSTLRASQLKALVSEAVRKHNVGLVIIDHFRYFDMDQRSRDPNVEDEDKARFLKESLAKDLDVAVVCIAHTVKNIETEDGRPRLKHLRGSGQVAAHADFVSFMYRPWPYATELAKSSGNVSPTDAEMLWEKNRHGDESPAQFYFDPSRMDIK